MGLLDLLGFGKNTENIADFVSKGAIIIDVRTSLEFAAGHIKGAKNIPLDALSSELKNIQLLNQPVIACCRSGMRSAQATSILKKNGIEAINGGGWESLQHKL